MYFSKTTQFLIFLSAQGSSAFTVPSFVTKHTSLSSSLKTDNDSTFSAFADSLEDEDLFEDEEGLQGLPSWQESLEQFLDPTTPVAKRQILLSDLLGSNEKIRSSVQEALRERKIDPLLTPTGKKLQDGTRAVARQITNDIIPNLSTRRPPVTPPDDLPTLLPKIGSRIFDAVSTQARNTIQQFQEDISDPSRIPTRINQQSADFAKEARNIFKETPEGLKGPKYEVVKHGIGYEIRDYEGYTVASTQMNGAFEEFSVEDPFKGGTAFNTLAAYIFGANKDGRSMEMTTPVSTTSIGEMRFYLSKTADDYDEFPQPLPGSDKYNERGTVEIVDIPPTRLACLQFPGFVTDGEVQRQKDKLLAQLDLDGVEIDVDHGSVVPHMIFQYNPPYTIPILRRNEIAIPLRKEKVVESEVEWKGDGEGEDFFPSDSSE